MSNNEERERALFEMFLAGLDIAGIAVKETLTTNSVEDTIRDQMKSIQDSKEKAYDVEIHLDTDAGPLLAGYDKTLKEIASKGDLLGITDEELNLDCESHDLDPDHLNTYIVTDRLITSDLVILNVSVHEE